MLYINERKPLFQQHPLTDFLFLYTMLKQETNPAVVNNSSPSTYCFDADAVNEFFLSYMPAETLARTIREFNHHVTILSLNTPDVPFEISQIMRHLNEFAETINPYFTNQNM